MASHRLGSQKGEVFGSEGWVERFIERDPNKAGLHSFNIY